MPKNVTVVKDGVFKELMKVNWSCVDGVPHGIWLVPYKKKLEHRQYTHWVVVTWGRGKECNYPQAKVTLEESKPSNILVLDVYLLPSL